MPGIPNKVVINDELISFPDEKTILFQDEKPDFVAIQKNVKLEPIAPPVIVPAPNDVSKDLTPTTDKDKIPEDPKPATVQISGEDDAAAGIGLGTILISILVIIILV